LAFALAIGVSFGAAPKAEFHNCIPLLGAHQAACCAPAPGKVPVSVRFPAPSAVLFAEQILFEMGI